MVLSPTQPSSSRVRQGVIGVAAPFIGERMGRSSPQLPNYNMELGESSSKLGVAGSDISG